MRHFQRPNYDLEDYVFGGILLVIVLALVTYLLVYLGAAVYVDIREMLGVCCECPL